MADLTGAETPMKRTTALLIPCPWSGSEYDPIPWTYWPWFRLYCATRRLRHQVGLHDWSQNTMGTKCTWCGATRCTWCGRVRRRVTASLGEAINATDG